MTASSRHLTIRNVPERVAKALQAERKRTGRSLNQVAIDLLRRAVGAGDEPNGLEKLAGSWTKAELAAFEKATAALDRVDEEHWK